MQLVEPPISKDEGFDSAIHFVRLAGEQLDAAWSEPLVLRVKPSAERGDVAAFEAAAQDWLADRSFPAPRVLAVLEPGTISPGPVQVMQRAPGVIVLDAVLSKPWRAPALVRRLAVLQAELHELPPGGFPSDEDLFDKRLRLVRATADALQHRGLFDALARVEALTDEIRRAPAVVCHGDYHPLNVLIDDDDLWVIDWTDAGVGDRHGDVARTITLFGVAAIAASSTVERIVLRAAGPILGRVYRRAYARHAPLARRRLELWTPVHLLHGWSQAVGVLAGVFDESGEKATADRLRPSLVAQLEQRCLSALETAEAGRG